ncbi:MAG: exo-beta-N-acetylmuramidase NamZ family protein [Schleiferiaceae bacterium]
MMNKGTRWVRTAVLLLALVGWSAAAQSLKYGAERERLYMPDLKGQRVALVAHAASLADGEHTVDRFLRRGVDLRFVFTPEHGFRATASAGEKVDATRDSATGLKLVSLYGSHRKPTAEDLDSIDVVVYDLQDLSIRFYTYVSTLAYVMEACAEHGKRLVVLDRPTPFANVVDGPVLDTAAHRSFVGLHPVPVLYGLTSGEYAQMAKGEGWIRGGDSLNLKVVPMEHYRRERVYPLAPPSPNLATPQAINWYPSLCFFEATDVSVGRGTEFAFQQYGAPWWGDSTYGFVPQSRVGAVNPPHEGDTCYGVRLMDREAPLGIDWEPLWEARRRYDSLTLADTLTAHKAFYRSFLHRLAGTSTLGQALDEGWSVDQFRTWYQQDLLRYQFARMRYVLYDEPPAVPVVPKRVEADQPAEAVKKTKRVRSRR